MKYFKSLLFLNIFCAFVANGQQLSIENKNSIQKDSARTLEILPGGILVAPIVLEFTEKPKASLKNNLNFTTPLIVFGTGVLLKSSSLNRAQTDWHNQKIGQATTSIDDYITFIPNAAVFGLDIVGIKAKHTFKQRMLVSAIANSINLVTVYSLKYTTKVLRPDGSARTSFPSGHTAFAFTGAQIVQEEYGQHGIIYGAGGYAIGAATGFLRMVNNRHWLSDVVAGAGIGMLSTKLAYKLLPWVHKKVFKNENLAIMPIYVPNGAGLGMAMNLK